MGEGAWNRETVPRVLEIVSSHLSQRDLCSVLLVNSWCYRALVSQPSLWKAWWGGIHVAWIYRKLPRRHGHVEALRLGFLPASLVISTETCWFRTATAAQRGQIYMPQVLDFHEMSKAGERLISALSLHRYQYFERLNLEFARDIDDEHLLLIKSKVMKHLRYLEYLNLNGCQKISDRGIEAITISCPKLRIFSIYWNIRVSDLSIQYLVKHCKYIYDLNLSGCKSISDQSMCDIGDNYKELEQLNITRCIKITDDGLQHVLLKCIALRSLNLYALSSLTDRTYEKIGFLAQLEFLDLCGAQNLSDRGLSCIADCRNLVSLNLTWCVRVTDEGVIRIAEGCRSLEFLSLFGIVGVTDRCLEVLSPCCSSTLTTLDVNGCIGIKRRGRHDLLRLFPYLRCFKVHS